VIEALKVLQPDLGNELANKTAQLHQQYRDGSGAALIKNIKNLLTLKVLPLANQRPLQSAELQRLLKHFAHIAAEQPYFHYEEAEQIAMAISSFIAADQATLGVYQKHLDRLYAALHDEEGYDAESFTSSAKDFAAAVQRK